MQWILIEIHMLLTKIIHGKFRLENGGLDVLINVLSIDTLYQAYKILIICTIWYINMLLIRVI